MAERVLINKQILQDSIDAIRAKKGTTDSIVVADMPTEIASIEGGGGGIADSTKTLVNVISGVTPTDETTLNNAIAKAYADTPSEQKWNDTRSTADGGTIKDGVAFVESLKGSTMKYNQYFDISRMEATSSILGPVYCSVSGNSFTITSTTRDNQGWRLYKLDHSMAKGSKILISFDILVTSNSESELTLLYDENGSYWSTVEISPSDFGVRKHYDVIFTTYRDATQMIVRFMAPNVEGDSFVFSNVQYRDLTETSQSDLTTATAYANSRGYADCGSMPFDAFTNGVNLLNFTHNTITSKDEDNATLDTLSLNVPSSVFPNGMMGVGSTYDEIRPAEGKAYTRLGYKAFNGTETWMAHGVGYRVDISDGVSGYAQAQGVCNLYAYQGYKGSDQTTDKICYKRGMGGTFLAFVVNDSAYESLDAWKAHLAELYASGKPMIFVYQLGTPTETTTNKVKAFYKVANGGTETISGGTDSAPIKADIGYREATATELLNALNG